MWHFLCQMRLIRVDRLHGLQTFLLESTQTLSGFQVEMDNNLAGLPVKEIPHAPCRPCGILRFNMDSIWNPWGSIKSLVDCTPFIRGSANLTSRESPLYL